MKTPENLLRFLEEGYRERTKKSYEIYREATKVMVSGGSHTLRLYHPYPFFLSRARGPFVCDVDGNSYLDYWQGHYANILGHNPEVIESEIQRLHQAGTLHTGFEEQIQLELAHLLLGQLGYKDHKVRFTTSGTLATMYAVLIAQAWTQREYVLKIGGGWHGGSPYLLKGINYCQEKGFEGGESAGLSKDVLKKILITRFNDGDDLKKKMKKWGKRIACFILEPFLGVGGFIAASKEYLDLTRKLTEEYGIVLIFDEIISGFRFCPSGVQKLYGIEPDLTTFGKLIGGGHAVAAVVGKEEMMECCGTGSPFARRVRFEGGTFSSHPEYMRTGYLTLKYLVANADIIYPDIAAHGEQLRKGIEEAFRNEGIEARCTGYGNKCIPGSSLFMVNFPLREATYRTPEELLNEEVSHVALRERVLKLALLQEGVHVVHGGGAVSLAHTGDHIEKTIAAYAEVAKLFNKYLF